MAAPTYESIQPNLRSAHQEGSTLRCTFHCPVSGEVVESQGTLRREKGLKDVAVDSVKRSAFYSLRHAVYRAVHGALGHGFLGRAAGEVASSMLGNMEHSSRQQAPEFSEEEKRAAVVEAFERVASRFVWDGKNRRYVSASAAGEQLSEFAAQLAKAPVVQRYDTGVMARMLVEVARADGQVEPEEEELLASFLPAELGSVEALAKRPPLSEVELSECASGPARETMLMLAWALALTDESLAPQEARRLERYARGLGLAQERAEALQRAARLFLFEQALDAAYPDGERDESAHEDALALAGRIGLTAEEAERADIRYRKRQGLI